MQMPFPKGSTALNCCWQVRASHHPRQPLSCGDLPARGEAAALGRHKKKPFSGRIKPGLGHSARAEGGGRWGLLPRRPQKTRGLCRGGPTGNGALWESVSAQWFHGHRGAGTTRVPPFASRLLTSCSKESFEHFVEEKTIRN